ncbi:MAG: 16S rRNA (cytosine(1402)-N(4))-methyltransferase RsmH [Acidimicrobiales bacterium]
MVRDVADNAPGIAAGAQVDGDGSGRDADPVVGGTVTPVGGRKHLLRLVPDRPLANPRTVEQREYRPSPYEAALAAVARSEVHIERVWPVRGPSTDTCEEGSSNRFHAGHPGTPLPGTQPIVGLRMSQSFAHEPVMASEVVALFSTVPPGLIVDATLGGAGHAAAILDAFPHRSVLGIDRDPAAVTAAVPELARFGERVMVRHARFDSLADIVRQVQADSGTAPDSFGLSGVLFDLGVSSPQLDVAERGFSYRSDAPLDMRMDPTSGPTGADVVNGYDENALVDLFIENGERRFARRIAQAIIAGRPVTTTGQLADLVRTAIPAATRRTGGHPARRVFQAVRIAVNEELEQLNRALDGTLELLGIGGRCVVLSYHSGEDRLVKTKFIHASTGGCACPPGLPCVCGAAPEYRLVVRGTRRPTPDEIGRNHRSEAARLRVIERITIPAGNTTAKDVVA